MFGTLEPTKGLLLNTNLVLVGIPLTSDQGENTWTSLYNIFNLCPCNSTIISYFQKLAIRSPVTYINKKYHKRNILRDIKVINFDNASLSQTPTMWSCSDLQQVIHHDQPSMPRHSPVVRPYQYMTVHTFTGSGGINNKHLYSWTNSNPLHHASCVCTLAPGQTSWCPQRL